MRDENAIERFLEVQSATAMLNTLNSLPAKHAYLSAAAPTVKESLTLRAQLIAEATERGWPIQETK